jgi:hypothetical protein
LLAGLFGLYASADLVHRFLSFRIKAHFASPSM